MEILVANLNMLSALLLLIVVVAVVVVDDAVAVVDAGGCAVVDAVAGDVVGVIGGWCQVDFAAVAVTAEVAQKSLYNNKL